ncbi:MAG: hypothetical protein HRT38_11060, partial [Alteromonadaceae bacterium]|nr:hypothetical protein [Alteromonadaceae bacterium]
IDLGKKFSNKELTKRYKSNRMWGFSALKKNEVLRFFADNPSIDYAIHIQSRVRDPRDLLFTDTDWFIYDKKAVIIAEINTSSVEKLENDSNTGQDYFNKALKLQKTNINEFLKLISKS